MSTKVFVIDDKVFSKGTTTTNRQDVRDYCQGQGVDIGKVVTFDSKMEYLRYIFLKEKEMRGEIRELELHKKFLLLPNYVDKDGKNVREMNYECDFYYYDVEPNKYVVEDVKGFVEKEFTIKKKLFNYLYKNEYSLSVIKHSKTTGWVDIKDYKKIIAKNKKAKLKAKNAEVAK